MIAGVAELQLNSRFAGINKFMCLSIFISLMADLEAQLPGRGGKKN
jgi:hypothetical protein